MLSHCQPCLISIADAMYILVPASQEEADSAGVFERHTVKGSLYLLNMSFVGHFPPWASPSLLSVRVMMLADPYWVLWVVSQE